MVTIVICAHNQLPYTKICLQSVIERTGQAFKLILVDSGSTDGTSEFFDKIKEIKPETVVLKYKENINTVKSYNEAMPHIDTEYVTFISNDQIVSYNWFKPIEKLLEDKTVGLASCEWVHGEIPLEKAMDSTENWNVGEGSIEIKANQPWCLRTEVMLEIGNFDPWYKYGWFMDYDYYNRVILKGYKIYQTTATRIYHFGSVTLKQFLDKRPEWNMRNEWYFVNKFKDVPDPEFTRLWGRGGHGETAVGGM